MTQAKFSLEKPQVDFVEQFRALGYRDKSELVRAALDRMRLETERKQLEESARLYAALYESDAEARAWTEDAISGWPD